MTKDQEKFLHLAVIEQKKYDEISEIMGIPRSVFAPWWEKCKEEREKLSKIRQIWSRKCQDKNLDFWDFHKWFTSAEQKCHYCGITPEEIMNLYDNDLLTTKRIVTRGKSLEIERLEPNKTYEDINNLVLCCYWCNNAKTDEFTVEEFKPIGKVMRKIWDERLKKCE